MKKGKPTPQAIIEFPVLLVNASTGEVEDTFHTYVKPDVHPKISQFCTELTGITREMVRQGIPLAQTLVAHPAWLDSHNLIPAWLPKIKHEQRNFLYLTCGDWDLKTCLPDQLAFHNQDLPVLPKDGSNVKKVSWSFLNSVQDEAWEWWECWD